MVAIATIFIILIGGWLIIRRADVRLVLGVSALALFAMAGKLPDFFAKFAAEMAKPETVVPICSALGFAYVLKLTECDKHLVSLLLKPLQYRFAHALFVPIAISSAYVVNMVIVSQAGVASVVGPILIPLALANGISRVAAGSMLLLGASMGGELFNPGAVEVVTIARQTHLQPVEVVSRAIPMNLLACSCALLIYWRMAAMSKSRDTDAGAEPPAELLEPAGTPGKVNFAKAFVPLVPLALLILSQSVKLPAEFSGYVTILAAMLCGVAAAAITSPKQISKLSSAFFEGAGFAYTQVISLIVTATLFTEGIKANGLIATLTNALSGQPIVASIAAMIVPWALAVASGSGIAPTVAVVTALTPAAARMHIDPVHMGTSAALAAHFGRTMSPVAAVTMVCATLSGAETYALVKRLMWPLAGAGLVLMVHRIFL